MRPMPPSPSKRRLILLCSVFAAAIVASSCRSKDPFAKWEKEIAAFEAADRKHPPPQNAILFIGSSSIRFWKTLTNDFPEHAVINRGFGGSQISDSTHFISRIVAPYHPKQ